jgi:uncharacterized protein (TIGR03792 family)
MVIEWLTFEMEPQHRATFIERDTEIWTAALQQYPGFLSKEVWIAPDHAGQVNLVIRWATREQWKAVPAAALAEITATFDQALDFDYRMVDSLEYQVRRFPVRI